MFKKQSTFVKQATLITLIHLTVSDRKDSVHLSNILLYLFHRHVVLGVHHNGKFGTLGLSRREDLMFKPLKFKVGRTLLLLLLLMVMMMMIMMMMMMMVMVKITDCDADNQNGGWW